MERKNIKASDVNHISMERNFIFFAKERQYVSTSSCFGSIISKFFHEYVSPSGKRAAPDTPLSNGNFYFQNPLPLRISTVLRGGGGMDIFWNHTLEIIIN